MKLTNAISSLFKVNLPKTTLIKYVLNSSQFLNGRHKPVTTQLMKLLIVITLCAIAAAAPKSEKEVQFDPLAEIISADRNFIVNILIRQLFAYVRHVIKNGSVVFGLPPLDPLDLESYHLIIPAGLVNIDLELKNTLVSGFSDFVVHRSNLQLPNLTFEIDISIPNLNISTELYDLTGNVFNAIPLYGNGKAIFQVGKFRFQAKIFLQQSDDEKSVIINRIEEASFQLTDFKSDLKGVIGGGEIDAIVNTLIEEVIMDYVNRFRGVISKISSEKLVSFANPFFNQLDTWKYIERLL